MPDERSDETAPGGRGRGKSLPSPRGLPLRIGLKLHRARLEKGLTIDQVAKATGLSKGFISQLEHDKTSASVASLLKLCQVLGTRVSSLFEPSGAMITRKESRVPSNLGGEGVLDYLLTPPNERSLQLIESHIDPGGTAGEELWSAGADVDCIYVLRGQLEVQLADQTITLRAGDSLTLSLPEPHTWRNPSKQKAVVIFALTPSVF